MYELRKLVEEINSYVDCVIVEGKRDEEALRAIGVKTKIVVLNRPGFEEAVEDLKRVLILTDFDREGRKLYSRTARMLKGKEIDWGLREAFGLLLTRTGRYSIESLKSLVEDEFFFQNPCCSTY